MTNKFEPIDNVSLSRLALLSNVRVYIHTTADFSLAIESLPLQLLLFEPDSNTDILFVDLQHWLPISFVGDFPLSFQDLICSMGSRSVLDGFRSLLSNALARCTTVVIERAGAKKIKFTVVITKAIRALATKRFETVGYCSLTEASAVIRTT